MFKSGGMQQHWRLLLTWGTIDAVIILSTYISTYLIYALVIPVNLSVSFGFVLAAIIITLTSLYLAKTYHRIWSRTSGHEITTIIGAVAAAAAVVLILNQIIVPHPSSAGVILLTNILLTGILISVRFRSRVINGLVWRWRAVWHQEFPKIEKTRVLVIGAGESGQALAWRLKHRLSGHHLQVVGFIDDDRAKQSLLVEGCPVLGTRHDIIRIASERRIDLIVLAIHNIKGPDFREILGYCEKTNARIKIVPDVLASIKSTASSALLRDVQPEDLIGRRVVARHQDVDLSPVMNKVVLITGAAGSIGAELSEQFLSYQPHHLLLLDNNESALHDLFIGMQTKMPALTITPLLVDITNLAALEGVFERYAPSVVFHAAAYKHVPMLELYPDEAVRVNVGGTRNLICLSKKHSVERFVLISTDKAVNSQSVMGASKRICELMIHAVSQERNHQTLFTAVRFGNVLGSRGSVVPIFERQIKLGGPVTVTHKDMTRYFMSISEAANLVIHAACMTEGDDIFVLRMGEVVRILDIAERMIRLQGLRPYTDIEILITGARPGEKITEELHDEREAPRPTVHPDIIKLSNWLDSFSADRLWLDIKALLAMRFDTNHSALAHFQSITSQDLTSIQME